MSKNRRQDVFPYLWLAVSMVLLVFSKGRWTFPLAPWIAFMFLLRFTRQRKPLIGYLAAVLAIAISSSIALYGIIPMRLPVHILFHTVSGIFLALPYLVDRLAAKRVGGLLSTFIFPVAAVSLNYIWSFIPAKSTWGSVAYTQYGILPLMQLVSITGLNGIIFLIYWFASSANFCWENGFAPGRIRKVAGVYICVLLAVFLYGGARLLMMDPAEKSVRVAAITTSSDIRSRGMMWLRSRTSPFNLEESVALMESQTVKAADAGAKIIAWQEYADWISSEDSGDFIQRGQKIAADKKVYLLLSAGILDKKKEGKGENASILISPTGDVEWKYLKSYLVPVVEKPYFKEGDKKIPVRETPQGRLASVICFDFDFPDYVRSAGRNISLMIVPAFDWKEITPLHAQMAVFRGIENGYSVLRPAGAGLSIAADACGRVVAGQNYFTSKERILLADVPVQSVFTLYSVIGNAFAWLCLAALFILCAIAAIRRNKPLP